jgi:uncharacterized protein YprB with RNaseH-like and TPR domain
MNTILFDIETSALVSRTWGTVDQSVIKVVKDWKILCFSYKKLGEKKTFVESLRNQTEKSLIKKLHSVLDEADVVIAHNGNRFDIRKVNAKFVEYGLPPTPDYHKIDTLKVARKYFAFTSNRLDDLGKLLGVGEKVKHPGFEMWEGCERGEAKWFDLMEKYNRQDVNLLEKVYYKLYPWVRNHPNVNVIDNKENSCPNCGSENLQRRGYGFTRTGKYQRFQCKECGAWSRGRNTVTNVTIR